MSEHYRTCFWRPGFSETMKSNYQMIKLAEREGFEPSIQVLARITV